MKFFRLNRVEDINGNSGTGVVATGIIFPNGKVAMSWRTDMSTVVIADSITVLEQLHGHNGRTQIEFFEPSKIMDKKLTDFVNGVDLKKEKEAKDKEKEEESITKDEAKK